ncbi:MAG: peptidoglycan editing factor PgeF [Pelotomaculaceae bacterium]|jgi:YfiH family protein|uniref:Polyphenol oxidase n=1 Tax=anaerobic digester metagenome TaxID=1263854 RepID=A0A485M1W8_9ZZZZ|nr:peptidoglycan editing factor PgeF [Bacillota bacterium]HHU87184.1 peptidoglycan editing factor PgeF [Peptococcaceae bacterium]
MQSLTFKGGLQFYIFPHFENSGKVIHGFTTRNGGVSRAPYSSLNTAFHVGDDEADVRTNRQMACAALGLNPADLVAGRQVHGDRIEVVGLEDRGRGAISDNSSLPGTDALVTGITGVPLSSYYADCVPVFLLDPVKGVIAIAHAGWKGTALRIAEKTLKKMRDSFGVAPRDCLAGIGPSVGPCCYEVDERVISPFQKSFPGIRDLAVPTPSGRWRLNLWEANRRTLLDAGLKAENIVSSRICTSCHQQHFYSYRAQGGNTGRMTALIMLK